MRFLALASVALSALAACAGGKTDAARDASADAQSTSLTAADRSLDASSDGARDRGALVQIAAVNQVSVCDSPAWPESNTGAKRLGYLRHGALVEAYESAIINDDCKEGWFELADGAGFVCSKYATVDLTSPRVRLAPRQPDRDAGLPYKYGVNLSDGTPLYRRVLGAEDRKRFEAPARKPATHEEAAEGEGEAHEAKDRERDKDTGEKEKAQEEAVIAAGVTVPDEEHPAASSSSAAPAVTSARIRDAGAADAAPPGKPRLRDFKGRGVLVRKMARGFYVALDRDFKAAGTRWWRTTFGFAAPFDKIMVQPGVTKYAGAWFDPSAPFAEALAGKAGGSDAGASAAGAVGFVTGSAAVKLTLSEDGKKMSWGEALPKRSAVLLDGRTVTIGGVTYHATTGGFWVQLASLRLAKPAPPLDLAPGEKWIDVDLTRQQLVAFEGTRAVFATLISSGRRNTEDKERDFPTPTGTFRIGEKHVTTTMDGDVASDGPYSIEDVPWVMYFQGSYALHGAFWHDSFGHQRSHGCVNLAPEDARTLFAWTDPPLPPGWHGVFAQGDKSTRVVIHEDPPTKSGAGRSSTASP